MALSINLLVLRCRDIEVAQQFYSCLGFEFQSEKHGNGPTHYAAENFGYVLELYPLPEGKEPDNVRLGFATPMFETISEMCLNDESIKVVKGPHEAFGRRAILLQDPDGRKVEVSELSKSTEV